MYLDLKVFVSHSHTMCCYESDCESMVKYDDKIKKSPKYPLIKDRYKEDIKEYNMLLKSIIDDQKEVKK